MKYRLLSEIDPDARGYSVRFRTADNKTYYAGLHRLTGTTVNECMIFPVVFGNVDWGREVYCNRAVELEDENLLMCIEEFCEELDDNAD